MLGYILRRLGWAIPLLLMVVSAVFLIFALIPGDPAVIYAGESASPDVLARVRHEFGLDKPLYVRYVIYLGQLSRGNMGASVFSGVPVVSQIRERFGNTLRLALVSIVVATLLGVSSGVVAAIAKDSLVDHAATLFALAGISIPGFWLGLLLIYVFAVELHWFPTGGIGGWQSYVLPAALLSVFSTAYCSRITRSAFIEVIQQDYIKTARAKGLTERVVVLKHTLRNAIIPIVTVMGVRLGLMLTGSVITETIFAWPGLGRLIVIAVNNRDYPVIQGTLLTFATLFVIVNLFVDLAYVALDPRIKYR
jgi:ABC-type dipeptide/oligopeptide/nickel transport system permease component